MDRKPGIAGPGKGKSGRVAAALSIRGITQAKYYQELAHKSKQIASLKIM
jgi:hypothetical protein